MKENMSKKHTTKFTESPSKETYWQIATGVMTILLIASIVTSGFGFQSESGVSAEEISKKAATYVTTNLLQGQGVATISSVEESNGMYSFKLNVGGQSYDSYATKDGKLLFPNVIKLDEAPPSSNTAQAPSADVVKADKPKVELFVMSHCPYGTQMEKGILPVANALTGQIDFEVKFVNYAMHGEKEIKEQLLQYCVQKDYNSKYLQYLGAFLEAGDTQKALISIGITESDLSSCIADTDSQYKITESFEDPQKSKWNGQFPPFAISNAENEKYGVQGSPTLVINGAQVNAPRDASSLLATICSSFNDKPEACNIDMSSYGNPAPGFGFETQGGSAQTAGCGV